MKKNTRGESLLTKEIYERLVKNEILLRYQRWTDGESQLYIAIRVDIDSPPKPEWYIGTTSGSPYYLGRLSEFSLEEARSAMEQIYKANTFDLEKNDFHPIVNESPTYTISLSYDVLEKINKIDVVLDKLEKLNSLIISTMMRILNK